LDIENTCCVDGWGGVEAYYWNSGGEVGLLCVWGVFGKLGRYFGLLESGWVVFFFFFFFLKTLHVTTKQLIEVFISTTGELGLSSAVYHLCQGSFKGGGAIKEAKRLVSGAIILNKTLLLYTVPEISPSLLEAIKNFVDARNDSNPTRRSMEMLICAGPKLLNLWSKFMNQSLLYKYRMYNANTELSSSTKRNAEYKSKMERYGTISAVTRTGTLTRESTLGSFTSGGRNVGAIMIDAEYRYLTVLFVKLNWRISPQSAQKSLETFLMALKKYSGVFQQFSG
jgi:hypothetical protein